MKIKEFIDMRERTEFKRTIGFKPTIFKLINFNLDDDFKEHKKDESHIYLMIPAYFPKQEDKGIKHNVKGFLLLTYNGLKALVEAYQNYNSERLNPLFVGYIKKNGEISIKHYQRLENEKISDFKPLKD